LTLSRSAGTCRIGFKNALRRAHLWSSPLGPSTLPIGSDDGVYRAPVTGESDAIAATRVLGRCRGSAADGGVRVFGAAPPDVDMELHEVEDRIEAAITEASAEVSYARPNDTDHLAAVVVSPAFEGKSLVEQHEMVYDAVGDQLTREIHALKVETHTPAEAPG
jgi:stress-induced morphogen